MKQTLFLLLAFAGLLFAKEKKVYLASIEGEINPGLTPYVSRVISDAEKASADAVIFRINTFGGRVDAATQIKDAILNSKIKTIAYIDKRAISAGALIALSCEKIAMVPGASIGASTVVDESGKKQSEKYQSYMRSEMRSTAERNGRRADIAEGMVDERIIIEGLVDGTKLITLTSAEARKYNIADTVVSSKEDLLKAFGLNGAVIVEASSNRVEDFVRFLNNPVVSSLLIMIGLVGLFVEIKTPGAVFPGLIAAIALILFFGSGYILQLASVVDIVMFIAGVVLLLLEIFVIPGFGIAGILGIVLMISGLFLSLINNQSLTDSSILNAALYQLAGSFVAGGVLIYLLLKILPKTNTFSHLILQQSETLSEGFISNPSFQDLNGKTGLALSVLRPAGVAVFNDRRIDVVSEGGYIEQGKEITVINVIGSRVIVREKKTKNFPD
ncbi:MAG: NfeD family protein [Ignavibacteria bacterium]